MPYQKLVDELNNVKDFKQSIIHYQELKELNDKMRILEERSPTELTPLLLRQLVNYVSYPWYTDNNFEGLLMDHYPSACGCMGPQNGNPFCSCIMDGLRYEYRYDIILAILAPGE
jgi:hypothetical protein